MVTREFCRVVRRKRVNSLTTSHRPVTARSRSSVAASSSLRRTMSDCPKEVFSLLISCLEKSECQNRTLRHTGRSFGAAAASTFSSNDFAHHLPARGLQWSHAAPWEEPHALILIAAVNDVDAVTHHRVMKSGAGILSNEAEELLPPRIVCVTKDFVSQRLEFFDGHRTN